MKKSEKKYPIERDAIANAKAIVPSCVDPRFSKATRHFLRDRGLWPVFRLPRLGGINDLTSNRRLGIHGDALTLDIRDSFEKVLDGRQLPFICLQHQQCRGCGQGKCEDEDMCFHLQSKLVLEARAELYTHSWFREGVTEFRGHFFHLDGSVSDIVLPTPTPELSLVA